MNDRPTVKIYRRTYDVPLPKQAYEGDAGFDLAALIDRPRVLEPFTPEMIPTGVFVAIPIGMEAQVRPRSSMSRAGILISFGTIDQYRGEIFAVATNLTKVPYEISPGQRIAQLVFSTVAQVSWEEVESVDDLGSTERGAAGFGSSGTH